MKFVPSINKMSQMKILLVNVLHTTLNEDNLPAVRATSPELCATQVAKIPRRCILLYDAVFVSQQSDLTLWREYSILSHFSIFVFNFYIQKHSYIKNVGS